MKEPVQGVKVLIGYRELHEVTGVSISTLERMKAGKKLPKHVMVSGCVRWRRDEILKWIEAGCPDQQSWEQLKAAKHPRG